MSISSSEDRYQISLNDQITLKPDGTFTITNITIDPISTLFSLAFSIVKNNDFALRLPLEMQDYLTEHPDINVNDMTNEQTQDMLKAIGMCPIGNYAIVMFFGDASQLLGDDYSDLKPTATFKPLFGDEYLTLIAG